MARGPYKLVMRFGPQVETQRFGTLEEAFDALAQRIPRVSTREERRVLGREYEPVKQVAGRLELRGPDGARGGVDVRGDGSAEAHTGRVWRRLVEQCGGETPYDALRRELGY